MLPSYDEFSQEASGAIFAAYEPGDGGSGASRLGDARFPGCPPRALSLLPGDFRFRLLPPESVKTIAWLRGLRAAFEEAAEHRL